MNISTPEKLCAELWRRLYLCSLAVLAMAAVVTVRLAYIPVGASAEQMIEMACWRISLLLAFQSAPLVWAHFIFKGYKYKRISIPLYQTMVLLRIPVATWAGGCLITAVILWPELNA